MAVFIFHLNIEAYKSMNKRILEIILVILIIGILIGAVVYFQVPEKLGFGYSVRLVDTGNSNGAFPMVANSTGSPITFNVTAVNNGIMAENTQAAAGWGAFYVRSTVIVAIADNFTSTPGLTWFSVLNKSDFQVTHFVKISNPLSFSVNLSLTENLTGGRTMSYNISSVSTNSFLYVVQLQNGSIQSNVSSPANTSAVIGMGTLLTHNTTVDLPAGSNLYVFLGIIPSQANNGTTRDIDSISSFGEAEIQIV